MNSEVPIRLEKVVCPKQSRVQSGAFNNDIQ